jgi:methylmalonyl-CoA/ethylmalonyl-CoA epimerase
MIRRIDHVGIAVRGLDERLRFWSEALGIEVEALETVESEQVKVAMLPVGESRLELLEATNEASAVAKHVAKRGEGIHHLTLGVADIEACLARLVERGIEVIGQAPRQGAGGSKVAFLHPRSTGGVLLELVERPGTRASERSRELIAPGSAVLLYLRDPQEKMWGVLRRLDPAGVVVEGIDLGSYDDWVAQIERAEESVVGPSVLFLPMSRVDKILLDRSSGHLPSLAERFERRVGRTVQQVIAELDQDEAG